jgi:hypothetical protein
MKNRNRENVQKNEQSRENCETNLNVLRYV